MYDIKTVSLQNEVNQLQEFIGYCNTWIARIKSKGLNPAPFELKKSKLFSLMNKKRAALQKHKKYLDNLINYL